MAGPERLIQRKSKKLRISDYSDHLAQIYLQTHAEEVGNGEGNNQRIKN
jgi:hypothetical protein